MELGDFPSRKRLDWLNLAWIITHQCTMNCPYCVGWKSKTPVPTLINMLGGVDKVVARMEQLRIAAKKNVYLTISGGEPTMVKQLPELYKELGKRGFVLELHTNLTTGRFTEWVNQVDPAHVGQIMATYHGWRLDTDEYARSIYMNNFHEAAARGFTTILKTVVQPAEITAFPDKMKWLQTLLPENAPILPWVFIHGSPKSVANSNGAYPQAYTQKEREILASVTKYRRTCQQLYCAGAGFFKGMPCDAGCSYAYMDISGSIFPCFGLNTHHIGDFVGGNFNFRSSPTACPANYCGTPFWGLWYGLNPWNYIPGARQDDAYYCRFGPTVNLP